MAKPSAQAGFTLIELLVVVTLTVMLMLSASAIMMTFLIGSAKTSSIRVVKQNGDHAAAQIELKLRNGVELLPNSAGVTCDTNMSEIRIKAYDNTVTTIGRTGSGASNDPGRIVFTTNGENRLVTSDAINLVHDSDVAGLPNNPNFNCQASSDGFTNYITTTFVLRKGVPGINTATEIVEERYDFGTNIRSR